MKHPFSVRSAFLLALVLVASVLAGSMVYAQRPKVIQLTVDGEEKKVVTDEKTIQAALEVAGYKNLEEAESSQPLSDPVRDQMEVTLRTQKLVQLLVGGESKTVATHAVEVGDLLQEEQVVLDENDQIQPAQSAKLTDGLEVVVDRMEEETRVRQVEVPFSSRTEKTEDMPLGETRVKVAGQQGTRELVTKETRKNGQLIASVVLSDKVVKEPVEEVVLEGTYDPQPRSEKLYTLGQFRFNGVVYYNGYKFTYYSQSVLPGSGLNIPGRHVNADGYVADGDGYIVLAGSAEKGTIFATPFGYMGKIYDRGTTGNHLDVYVQ